MAVFETAITDLAVGGFLLLAEQFRNARMSPREMLCSIAMVFEAIRTRSGISAEEGAALILSGRDYLKRLEKGLGSTGPR